MSHSRRSVETLANLAVVGNVAAVRRALDGASVAEQRRVIAQADRFGQSPLDHAARQGHVRLLEFFRTELLDDDVAALSTLSATRNATRQTPLIGAADAGQLDVVVELVHNWHADVYARDENGYTAVHCAAASDHADVIEFLIGADCHADMLRGSDDKHTPLHSAATFGSLSALRSLLRLGANPNAVETNFRATPLALAIFNRHVDCVAALLDAGADLDRHRNAHGHTAFDLAQTSSPEVRALVDAARTAQRARRADDDDWGEILGDADSTVAVLAEPDADASLLSELDDIVIEDPGSWQLDAAPPQPAMPPVAVLEALLSVLRNLTELAPPAPPDDVDAPALVLRAPFC